MPYLGAIRWLWMASRNGPSSLWVLDWLVGIGLALPIIVSRKISHPTLTRA